jgi:hypothetical protein
MGGTLLRPLCLGGSLVGLISEVGLKLEGFDEVEDVMFWLCALWKTVDGLMGEDNMRQRQEGILIPTRPS